MNIMLVDDEPLVRGALSDFLEDLLGHDVVQCENGKEALEIFKDKPLPMVLTDLKMPVMDGLELLENIKSLPGGKNTDVVILTGHGDINTVIHALRNGAYDYLQKPVNVEELASVVDKIVEHQHLLQVTYELSQKFEEKVAEATRRTEDRFRKLKTAYEEIVGVGKIGIFSDAMKNIADLTQRLHNERDIPVLIEGETGTGKEIVAKMVHYGPGDVTSPSISINCSAISANLFESDLFGYEGGAFTGSRSKGMIGKFELAQGGTLFLDEIGDLPLDMQPKFLRALQEREIYRVGGIKKINLDVRIICTTNRNLSQLVEQGAFRRDLFYRLNMARIFVPPLRERKDEIVPMAQMFLEKYAEDKKRRFRFISKDAVKILENHDWPGNIRELQNAVERIVLLFDDMEVRPAHLGFLDSNESGHLEQLKHIKAGGISVQLPDDSFDLNRFEKDIVKYVLKKFAGNKSRAASYLGLTRSALRSRI